MSETDPREGEPRSSVILSTLRRMIDSGEVAEMSPRAFEAYVIHLVKYANAEGHAWPGEERLGLDMGVKPRSVRSALTELKSF